MKTTIYWTIQHSRRALHEFCFRATCWWLSQQVECLEWRLKLETVMPSAPSSPKLVPIGRAGSYAVPSMR
jgi:hypothetical protein